MEEFYDYKLPGSAAPLVIGESRVVRFPLHDLPDILEMGLEGSDTVSS